MACLKNKLTPVLSFLLLLPVFVLGQVNNAATMLLDGKWQMGFDRKYDTTVVVPGINADPTHINNDELWFKKTVKLPAGNWTAGTLELKGARFKPRVYINGELIAEQEGGMAPVFFTLKSPVIRPGNTVILEIALASLKNVPQTDASYIPGSDQWRSDVSSGLWDDVVLHVHGDVSINRVIPFVDFKQQKVDIRFDLNQADDFKGKARVQVLDSRGKVLLTTIQAIAGIHNRLGFAVNGRLKSWSPQSPNLYSLKLTIMGANGQITDQSVMALGIKQFEVNDKQFYLNSQHFIPRGVTVVWHRWVRTSEGRKLGYDTAWFRKNIVTRSKDHGANYLRFHLGLPPEKFLDLCDKYGLVVQYEWSFFHGMPASRESLMIQYKNWLNLAMKHPSVCLIHPYNETGGDQLKTAWSALDELLIQYPPQVLEDRDVMHIHKYWWSLFENLGLYYDNAAVFPKAIMADEFGGNYLDENGDLGKYPSVKESFLRFLGRQNTAEERLDFQAAANARVAEYWRRIGAAGFSPFCALASNEDGNTWFLGPLKQGKPKPVWDALTAAFSPQSVSVELWDKNFEAGQQTTLPVYLFNDDAGAAALSVTLTVENKAGKVFFEKHFITAIPAFGKVIKQVAVILPPTTGDYVVKATLLNKPAEIKYPVVSEWEIRVITAVLPGNVKNIKVGVADDEPELKAFLNSMKITAVDMNTKDAGVIITSLKTWGKIARGDSAISNMLRDAIAKGKSVVMLDVGDRQLGQGYPKKAGDLGPLQGVASVSAPVVNNYSLFDGVTLKFTETAEPESYIHPARENRELWGNMPDAYTGIWNGLRGGLIVPAANMEFSGLSANAFVAQWKARGALEDKIVNGPYFAYELQGFYDFSDQPDDAAVRIKLKDKVHFLVQDAPSLANSINLNTPVTVTNLAKNYQESKKGLAENFTPLANCAKNLTQTPVALIGFGKGKGVLIVSQLLTAGRLAKGFGQPGLYGIRYDEASVQYVLNMISLAIKNSN